ncbi:MAG: hypothetical protein GXY22_00780 [Clostridiaceae bacterium]|jgi:hypothetical protein|nr:hypothetical protein [Clostridiaceae bacterium]
MYKSLLTKKFFRDNPIEELSTQRFVYSILTHNGIEELANEYVLEYADLGAERLERIKKEREQIQSEQDPDELLNLLRKNLELNNRVDLVKRVLEFEEELVPKVVEKLVRSDNDNFIDNAMRLLARSEQDYSPLLYKRFNEIRRPYVQSMVCLILGIRGGEEIIPWMINQYQEMKRLYPDETYNQGPLLALHELKYRFYDKKQPVAQKE